MGSINENQFGKRASWLDAAAVAAAAAAEAQAASAKGTDWRERLAEDCACARLNSGQPL